jgi:hypothetical protein
MAAQLGAEHGRRLREQGQRQGGTELAQICDDDDLIVSIWSLIHDKIIETHRLLVWSTFQELPIRPI